MSQMLQAVEVYRDSPNTFGHEENDVPRRELKKLMGATASQRYLQDSIKDALATGEYDELSRGIRHLWDRLKNNEDVLREAEGKYGAIIASRPYLTIPGNVHSVPTIALQVLKMEANKAQ